MSKRWSADHVRLAGAAQVVRSQLRLIAWRIGGADGLALMRLATQLTHALKARGCRSETNLSE
jgi:hypothetical protein